MITYSTPEKNKTLRLNITSVSGYYNLFLQFNYSKSEKKGNYDAYETLTLLMSNRRIQIPNKRLLILSNVLWNMF